MASLEASQNLTELVRGYNIACEVWPEYLVVGKEIRKVGFELELLGAHSSDSYHFDPACPKCERVRASLLAIAGDIVARSGNSVKYEIVAHLQSVKYVLRRGHRPFLTVSIRILHKQEFDQPIDAYEMSALQQIKGHLEELGVAER